MTNADVIRNMSDDELYKFLQAIETGDIDYSLTFCSLCKDTPLDCDECFKRWLFGDADDYNGLLADKSINSRYADRKTKNSSEIPNSSTISKMEQVDKDINVRSKDEPQTDCVWG